MPHPAGLTNKSPTRTRLALIDIARGVALVAMAIYHFTWDLEFFGYIEQGTTFEPGWKYFARAIASTFIFLVGVGLVLAHPARVRVKPFLHRLAKVIAAALLVTVATFYSMPETFIFFGILHSIALGSVLALPFLRLPWFITMLAAVVLIAGSFHLQNEMFDEPYWYWLGLGETLPRSFDYEPVFPWFGAVLFGIAAGRLSSSTGFFQWLARWNPKNNLASTLAFFGRHSLVTYLVHQPMLYGALWILVTINGGPDRTPAFVNACKANCSQSREEKFCRNFCTCVTDELKTQNLWQGIHSRQISIAEDRRVQAITRTCTARSDQ